MSTTKTDQKKKTYTRYLVVKIKIEIDCSETGQNPDDHYDDIIDHVSSELDYDVNFEGKVESGDNSSNSIEVPVKITSTEVQGLLAENPC